MIVCSTFSATFSFLTFTKESLLGAFVSCLSFLRSSNDSLEDVSLRVDSSIASLLVKFPSLLLEALLLLLDSEHSRVALERTSSLDLMMITSCHYSLTKTCLST